MASIGANCCRVAWAGTKLLRVILSIFICFLVEKIQMEDFSHFLITLFFTLYFNLNVKWANLIISKRIAERRKNGCKKISLHQYNDETHAPCCYNYPCRLKLNLDFYNIDWSCRLEGASSHHPTSSSASFKHWAIIINQTLYSDQDPHLPPYMCWCRWPGAATRQTICPGVTSLPRHHL